MKKLSFSFSTKLTFDDYVHDHSFALRIMPPDTASQTITSCDLKISPHVEHGASTFSEKILAVFIVAADNFLRSAVSVAGAVIVSACTVFAVFLIIGDISVGEHYFQLWPYKLCGFWSSLT